MPVPKHTHTHIHFSYTLTMSILYEILGTANFTLMQTLWEALLILRILFYSGTILLRGKDYANY